MEEKKLNNEGINPIDIFPIEISPMQYFAKAETKNGEIRRIPVCCPELAGMCIPCTVDNPEEFLRESERKIISSKMRNASNTVYYPEIVPPISTQGSTGTGIIRPKKSEEANVSDLANFVIYPKTRYIYIGRKGEEDHSREKTFCEIVFNGIQRETFTITTEDIPNLCKFIKKRYAIACIDFETKNVEKQIIKMFREAVAKCPIIYRYYEQGWQIINKEMVYAHKSAKCLNNVEYALTANLPLIRCDRTYIGRSLLIAFSLCNDSASMSTMIMFSLLGVLYRPFREAGYPPKFLLFLHGKTGSMKTTIAKILYTQLADDMVRDTPRRIDSDTIVSFERAVIESGYDTVTLIDDYRPAKSKKKKDEMADKLESIIRLVGDMSSKSRSNVKLEDCRGEGVQGTVVLTGELRGKGLSSNLRCLYCKMAREKVNINTITWFQEHPSVYTTIINEFAEFVGANWQPIVTYIRNNFPDMRRKISAMLSERRLVDSVVTLHMVYHIMLLFLLDHCGIDEMEVIKDAGSVEQDIINNAKMSQAISSEDSPSVLFIKTINDLMRVGTIVLGTGKMTVHDVGKYDGYDDLDYFYFNPEMIFKKVRSFLSASNIDFPMDLNEIKVALYDDGIIKAASNGKGKRTYCVRIGVGDGKKQNFLKISKVMFRKVLDNSIDIVW